MRTTDNALFNPDCGHKPSKSRIIRYTCLCCHRVVDRCEETYTVLSCSSCDLVMTITIVENGKVVDFGGAKIRVLARKAS